MFSRLGFFGHERPMKFVFWSKSNNGTISFSRRVSRRARRTMHAILHVSKAPRVHLTFLTDGRGLPKKHHGIVIAKSRERTKEINQAYRARANILQEIYGLK